MFAVIVISGLVGAVLATRFRVFALVPTILIVIAIVALGGALGGETARWIGASMLVAVAALQFGYLGASLLRRVFCKVASPRWPVPEKCQTNRYTGKTP
jgi:hypothetical protein